jgi:hypothetical protein
VTLIFYRINPKWWKEPALNLASAVCQMSNLTHCEISIGEVNKCKLKLVDRHLTRFRTPLLQTERGRRRADHEARGARVQ